MVWRADSVFVKPRVTELTYVRMLLTELPHCNVKPQPDRQTKGFRLCPLKLLSVQEVVRDPKRTKY